MSQKKNKHPNPRSEETSKADKRSDKMFLVFLAVFLAATLLVVGGIAIYSALQNPETPTDSTTKATGGEDEEPEVLEDPAHPGFSYTVNTNGTATLFYYIGETTPDTELVIPDTLGGHSVTDIRKACFLPFALAATSPKSVFVPKSVTLIGENAFGDLAELTVIYEGSREEWESITVGDFNEWYAAAEPTFQNK